MRIAVAGATGLVGRPLVEQARAGGHDVVEIARSRGIDVITTDGLQTVLSGADALVDVTQSPSLDQQTATDWFTTAARGWGRRLNRQAWPGR